MESNNELAVSPGTTLKYGKNLYGEEFMDSYWLNIRFAVSLDRPFELFKSLFRIEEYGKEFELEEDEPDAAEV